MKADNYLMNMGKRLKKERLARKKSLADISKVTGIHLTSLWFIENGRSNAHILTLKAIAEAFDMNVKDFL